MEGHYSLCVWLVRRIWFTRLDANTASFDLLNAYVSSLAQSSLHRKNELLQKPSPEPILGISRNVKELKFSLSWSRWPGPDGYRDNGSLPVSFSSNRSSLAMEHLSLSVIKTSVRVSEPLSTNLSSCLLCHLPAVLWTTRRSSTVKFWLWEERIRMNIIFALPTYVAIGCLTYILENKWTPGRFSLTSFSMRVHYNSWYRGAGDSYSRNLHSCRASRKCLPGHIP